jgi:hypothetical protein
MNQSTAIPRVPSEKTRQRQADKMQHLVNKHKGAEDLSQMILNPDELERLLNELVDYYHQLHFLAVIVNLFNVINASTGVVVDIKRNSSGTTSLVLQQSKDDLNKGVTPSNLPESAQKMFGTGVDPEVGQQTVNKELEQLQTDHDQLTLLVENRSTVIDAYHDERKELLASIESSLQRIDEDGDENDDRGKGVNDQGVSGVQDTDEDAREAVKAAGDIELQKINDTIATAENEHAALAARLDVITKTLKRKRRSTLLHVPKPNTGTALDLDSLQKAERIDRYVNDLVQELVPSVGSTLRKGWDKYSTDAKCCSYLCDEARVAVHAYPLPAVPAIPAATNLVQDWGRG